MLDFTPSATEPSPAIASAAAFVATAAARYDAAAAALAEAERAAARVRERVTALTQERAAMVSRRAQGQHEDGDAARLALIGADLDGLEPLAAEADASVAALRQKAESARSIVTNAQGQLARAEDEAALTALVGHAQALDVLLVSTLQQITATSARLGVPGRPPFAPSPALALEMRRLCAAHGLL